MQKLIMPFQSQMMLCGYKNAQYRKHWGYEHYGVDISTIQGGAGEDHTIYASGSGTVVAAGRDTKLGYGICILYRDAWTPAGPRDLIARYMHCREMYVKPGQTVEQGDRIALEGKEGTGDYHLHLEFDTDTNYPRYTPQVAQRQDFWMRGTDTTVNPSTVLHIGSGQAIVEPTYNPAWLNPEDREIPALPEDKPKDPPLDSGTIGIRQLAELLQEQYSITNIDLTK